MGFFFLCDSSLLVYRKVTDFCILILYPATLPDSLISNSFFLVETLRFFIYSIMSSTNINSFTSPPPIWMPFISFSCLIAVTGTSNNMLNRNSKCGYHCLVFEFKGKAFSFSPLSLMLASLGFSMYTIMSSANSDSFTSFPICIPFISFSSLIAMARTFKTMLNNSGKSGRPCLVSDLRGNAFSFSPLKMMFAVGLLYMAFVMLR